MYIRTPEKPTTTKITILANNTTHPTHLPILPLLCSQPNPVPIADQIEMNSVRSSIDSPSKFNNNHHIHQNSNIAFSSMRPDSGGSVRQQHPHHLQSRSSSSHFSTPPNARKSDDTAAHNNVALIKIGEASALPVMLCGILQNKELFYQQALQHQKEQQYLSDLQAASPEYYSA